MEYNSAQLRAIRHKDGPMLVLAGPGSGKTAVITRRVRELIASAHVDPGNILVITFTRAAAREMKNRFLAEADEDGRRVTFGTFHSVFFFVLKLAYHFTADNVISAEQRYRFLREILSYHHLEYRDESEFIGDVLAEIGRVKNERIPLAHFYSACCGEEVFRKIYAEYDERLRKNRLIDFDDMLTYTYELFRERKDILSAWQKKYKYVLIDEFQDINPLQWDIVQMLAAPDDNLFAVGDDDQSIYRFRGSKPEIMLGFKEVYPQAELVSLDTNYRCPPQVVKTAGAVIAHNEKRFPKEIRANGTGGDAVRFLTFEDCRKENAFIAEDIRKNARNMPLSEMAVLFRTNRQPRALMEQMVTANLAFRTKDKIPDIYDHWIARDFFTYIRLAQGSRSRADFLSVMNKPMRYIGRDSLPEPEVVFEDWIARYRGQPWIAERIEKLWYDLKHIKRLPPYAAINYIRQGVGYDDYLADYAEYRNADKADFYETADELMAGARGFSGYREWFSHIQEYRDELKRIAAAGQTGERVTFATLHSAKGLEFGRVYIIDANEGVMPYRKAVLKADLEEERRLFYVGMTRAKESLTICSVKKLNGKDAQPSRFLNEARETGNPVPSDKISRKAPERER